MRNLIRVSILSLFLFLCSHSIFAQNSIAWDSLSTPSIYAPLVEQFGELPPQPDDIVLIGNSIIFGGNWQERLSTLHVKNQGIPGDNTFGLLNRIKLATINNPSKIIILIGINDLAQKIPTSVILKNYERIIKKLKKETPLTELYICSILPTNPSFDQLINHYNKEEETNEINNVLEKESETGFFQFIDLSKSFVDKSGHLKKEYTWDGVHLTQLGYSNWVKILKSNLVLP